MHMNLILLGKCHTLPYTRLVPLVGLSKDPLELGRGIFGLGNGWKVGGSRTDIVESGSFGG